MEISKVDIGDIGLYKSNPSDQDYKKVGEKLFEAFEKIGFVYITGHGISNDVISYSMETSKEFFLLPESSKKLILRDPEIQQGYVSAGQELFNSKLVRIFIHLYLFRECFGDDWSPVSSIHLTCFKRLCF